MARWYAGAVTYRIVEGKIEFLVHDTKSTDPKFARKPMQTKFFGGTEKSPDKDVVETLRRELREETDLELPLDVKPLAIHQVPGTEHFKMFYLIRFEELEGRVRETEKTMEGDWMSAPYWVDFEKAKKILYGDHNTAGTKAYERLSRLAA